MKTPTYDWAKRYHEIGWSIFPVNEDKTPAVKEWIPYRTKLATEKELHEWFDDEKCGIALVTGKLSGVMVIDDDTAKKSGLDSDLVKYMKSSVCSKTAGGGKHFFLKYEEGFGNRIKIAGADVDMKTEGGYVIIPPSIRTVNGKQSLYEWVSPPTPENIAKMPSLSTTPEVVGALKQNFKNIINPTDYLFLGEGTRNDALFKLTRSFLNRLAKNEVWDIIYNINKNYNPPLYDADVKKLFESAVRYYEEEKRLRIKKPRSVDEILTERMKEREFEKIAPATGYSGLDRLIVGFVPCNLYCLTGETNAGKTTLACNFAVNVAKQGKKVLYIALETGNRIVEVLASIRLNKPYKELTKEDMSDKSGLIDLFVDRDIESIGDLKKTLTELDTHYDLIVIDHIGYFVSDKMNYLQEQANILKELRHLSKEKKTALMIIAHLRKRGKNIKKDVVPTSDDISGSASFKQDSTDVMIVIRQKDSFDEHHLKVTDVGWLYITKTKGNSVGVVDLKFYDVEENKKAIIAEKEVIENFSPKETSFENVEQRKLMPFSE